MYCEKWNRKKIIDFVNNEVARLTNPEVRYSYNPMDTIQLVEKFRRENNYPKSMIASVYDGFLYINNIPAGRIAAKIPRVTYSAGAAYWEGRILARQENAYD